MGRDNLEEDTFLYTGRYTDPVAAGAAGGSMGLPSHAHGGARERPGRCERGCRPYPPGVGSGPGGIHRLSTARAGDFLGFEDS